MAEELRSIMAGCSRSELQRFAEMLLQLNWERGQAEDREAIALPVLLVAISSQAAQDCCSAASALESVLPQERRQAFEALDRATARMRWADQRQGELRK